MSLYFFLKTYLISNVNSINGLLDFRVFALNYSTTRTSMSIEAKLYKSDGQMNIDKYSANSHIETLRLLYPRNHHLKNHDNSTVISYQNIKKSTNMFK